MIKSLSNTLKRLKRLFFVYQNRLNYIDKYDLTDALREVSPYTRSNRIQIQAKYNVFTNQVANAIKKGLRASHQVEGLSTFEKQLRQATSGGRNYSGGKLESVIVRQMRDEYISYIPQGFKSQYTRFLKEYNLFGNLDFWKTYFQSPEGSKQFKDDSYKYNEERYFEILAEGGGTFTDTFNISPQLMLTQSFYAKNYDSSIVAISDVIREENYTPATYWLKEGREGSK